MSIKYGELTIIYNKEEIPILKNILMWLNYEENPPKKSKYIFLFDDGEVRDSDNFKDLNFKFCDSILYAMPVYFEKQKDNNTQTYFYKTPIKNANDNLSLNFNKMFKLNSKYKHNAVIASRYNSIYYCYKVLSNPEIFSIVRIKSNEYMPRFQFAYDSNEFTKDEIIYFIHYVFNLY